VAVRRLLLESGSQRTLCWREVDSNFRFRARLHHGFLAGSDAVLERPAVLIATSAGEVGVDLDADHMVCDLVAWERMVQRLGRVNRRGERGDTEVRVIDASGVEKDARRAAILAKTRSLFAAAAGDRGRPECQPRGPARPAQ
jgi:CRISPR-associated helicase Cas3